MYKAVIFDLDGTLLDSLNDILAVLNETLKYFGLPQITREQAQSYIGNGARELVHLAIGSDNVDRLNEILAYYKAEYAVSDNKLASLYEGEEEVLYALKERGVKIAILTNKPHAAAMRANGIFFEKFGFDLILGQTDGIALKPAPDAVYKILKELRVKKEECLFVGDGEADVETAKNAGMDCVSVLWGY
ncbi:MAG: HAD family hydrolase, partial [Clostridia bacterium]|nr:HAD family hydrolase [Clostridia bacterium]